MESVGDIDPGYPLLLYLADRYELNPEQRYWLAFLYAATYHAPTAFYIYNEFPDFENVDLGRLTRWWKAHKRQAIFQTDRRWTKSRNLFVPQVASYTAVVRGDQKLTQEERFYDFLLRGKGSAIVCYEYAYDHMLNVYQMGRYSMFLYLEAVAVMTGIPLEPDTLDLRNSTSSRNGLCYACGLDELLTGKQYPENPPLRLDDYYHLEEEFKSLMRQALAVDPNATVWSVETSLCAYKKIHRGTRYLGYYIDRQHDEIAKSQALVTDGVDWHPLWDFRQAHFPVPWLKEMRAAGAPDPRTTRLDDPDHWYHRSSTYV